MSAVCALDPAQLATNKPGPGKAHFKRKDIIFRVMNKLSEFQKVEAFSFHSYT